MSKLSLHIGGTPWRVLLLIVVSVVLAPNGVAASDTTYVRALEEVSVSASRMVRAALIPSQQIEGEALRRLSAHSVADAVRYFSGVQIKDYGGVGGLKTIDIRSMGTNHVGVFYDGIQIGNAQNGTVDLGKFSLDNMEAVAVVNGQKSDLLQPAKDYGTSGSIYLRTRRPVFQTSADGTVKALNASASFRTGSFGLVNPSVLVEGRMGDRLSLSANAELTSANGRYTFRRTVVTEDAHGHRTTVWDTTGVRQNGDVSAWRTEATLFGNTSGGALWHTKLYYYDSERGIPRAIVRNVWTSSQRQWDRDFFAQAAYQNVIRERLALKCGAKYARDEMRYLNPDTTLLYVDNRFTQHEAYVTVASSFAVCQWLGLALAQDWARGWMWSDMVGFPRPVRVTSLTALAMRCEWGGVRLQCSALANVMRDRAKSGSLPSGDHSHLTHRLTPAAMLSFDVADGLTARAFVKRSFRMPTFNDLYYTDMGNVSLRPEAATQANVGLSFVRLPLNLSADVYRNVVKDKIVAIPKGNSQYRWMMMNLGRVEIVGADVKAKADVPIGHDGGLMASASYTFQRAADRSDPSDDGPRGTYGGQIAYVPRHSGSVIAQGRWRAVSLNYSFIYVGERYHTSANTPENLEPSWYTHDMAVRYSHTASLVRLQMAVEVNNILNQQYDVVLNYPMPGRNVKFILKVEI